MSGLINQQAVRQFIDVAELYCTLIEKANDYRKVEFLEKVQRLIAELYLRAMSLPDVEPNSSETLGERISQEEWGRIFSSLRTILGEHDLYSMVFDPIHPEDDDPITSSLSDDLDDIYRDIKNGLIHVNNSHEVLDVIWEWKFSFKSHWGQHATDALKAIHSLLYGPYGLNPD